MVTIEITDIKQRRNDDEEVETYVVEYRIPGYPNTYRTDPIPADEFDDELAKERVAQEASPLISGTTTEIKLPNETADDPDTNDRRTLLKYGIVGLLGVGTAGGSLGILTEGSLLGGGTGANEARPATVTQTQTQAATPSGVEETDTEGPTPTPTVTRTPTRSFEDHFEDEEYQTVWDAWSEIDSSEVDITEENGVLLHNTRDSAGLLMTDSDFRAQGTKRIAFDLQELQEGYKGTKFGMWFGSERNGYMLTEINNAGYDGFLFEKTLTTDNVVHRLDDRISTGTPAIHALTINFDERYVEQVTRGEETYTLGSEYSFDDIYEDTFTLFLGAGQQHRTEFERVYVADV